ncbi:hypothetical protein HOY82DRAFT_574313, partial [Tuber indicum]
MFRTKLPMRLVGSRPIRGLRSRCICREATRSPPTQPSNTPTTQPTTATNPTKDRLWQRLSEVEHCFGSLMKDFYEREVGTKVDFAALKAGQRLIGWHVSAFVGAGIATFSAAFGV